MRGERDDDDTPPGLPINNDGDPTPPPTNKMPLFDSRSSLPAFSSFVSSSSANVGSAKRKVRPIFATMNECPHSPDWYYPHNPTTKCISYGDEHTCAFLQSAKTLNYRNHQNNQTVGHRKNGWGDEMCPSTYPYSSSSSPQRLIHHDRASKVGIAVKKEEFSDICIPGLNLTTDEVVRVIGPKLFLKARKTMIHQQKMFSWQMFELHRLITVQRLIARSPETFHLIKPSIKFPPMNKLLYVSPLDTSSSSPKTKTDALKPDPGLPLSATSVEKGHLAQLLPNPAPWCFPPPPGNQWLIPVRSPSEGLVYKPYPGPCFPTVGFMTPVYGNCGPMSLGGSLSGTTYGVPAPNEHGSGGCYNAESYFQPYPMPLINASCSISEVKAGEVDKSSFKLVSDLHKQKESERPEWLERDALSLFSTTPSVDVFKEHRNEQKVQVIKVIPHNRDSTPASAARILQSLQEGRRKHD